MIFSIWPDQLKTYFECERKWYPDFWLHLAHTESELWPIIYIKPNDANIKMVGLDMAFETDRYAVTKKHLRRD